MRAPVSTCQVRVGDLLILEQALVEDAARSASMGGSSPVAARVAALDRLMEGTCALAGGDVVSFRQPKPCHYFLAEAADNW